MCRKKSCGSKSAPRPVRNSFGCTGTKPKDHFNSARKKSNAATGSQRTTSLLGLRKNRMNSRLRLFVFGDSCTREVPVLSHRRHEIESVAAEAVRNITAQSRDSEEAPAIAREPHGVFQIFPAGEISQT